MYILFGGSKMLQVQATVEGKRSFPAFIDKYISTQLLENDEYLRQLVKDCNVISILVRAIRRRGRNVASSFLIYHAVRQD